MMIRKIDYKILFSLCINLLIVSFAIFVFGTHLYQDDDSILSWMTFGIITRSSPRVFYTNVILGWIYEHLFRLIPGFNWQTFIHYVGLLFSGTIGLYAVFNKKNPVLVVFWFLFELVFFNDVYVYLTYSVVSAFLACQGYLALFLALEEKKKNLFFSSGIALVFSSLIRIEPFISVSGFFFFVWIILVILDYKEKQDFRNLLKKYVYPFAQILGVCLILFLFDRSFYSKGEWKDYKDYENARSIITDEYNCANRLEFEPLEAMGVTEEQALAVVDWRCNDPEIITIDLLNKIVTTKDNYRYLTSPYVWGTFWGQWWLIFRYYTEIYFSFGVIVVLSLLSKKLTPALLVVPFFLEVFYLAYIGRVDDGLYPQRSLYVIFMALTVAGLTLHEKIGYKRETKNWGVGIAIGVLIFAAIVPQRGKDFSVNGLGLVDVDEVVEEYGFLGNTDKIYVCEYAVRTEVEEAFGAWQVPPAGFMDHTVVLGSWLINHPEQNRHQASLGCSNPYRALFENDNVYFIRLNSVEESVLSYLRENYDERMSLEYVKKKHDFAVFKFVLEE